MARRPLVSLLATALAVAGLTALATAPAAHAAVPDTIPLTYTNHSGRAEPLYIYDLGTQLSTGRQGWADASGTFHAWPAGGNPPGRPRSTRRERSHQPSRKHLPRHRPTLRSQSGDAPRPKP